MADAIYEFYNNDSLGYSDLSAGVNIGGTTASQKAVIRDIRITNTGNKTLSLKLGNHSLGTATATETFSGTELLKESQNITLSSADTLLWTGMRYHADDGRQYSEVIWDSDWFFTRPVQDDILKSTAGWNYGDNERFRQPHSSTNYLHNYTDFNNNQIAVWPAKECFGKSDTKDYYYTQNYVNASANSNTYSSKIYYYDASADTSTQIYAGNTSNGRRAWHGMWSNRYMVLPDNQGGNAIREFSVLDTTDNSITANRSIIRGYDEASGENRIEDVAYSRYYLSCCNKYAFIKHSTESTSSRMATLFDVTTGRFATWDGNNSYSNYQTRFMSNSSSYNFWPTPAQIAQSDNGQYYVMWLWLNGSSVHEHGLTVWCLGSDPADKYLKLGVAAGANNYPEYKFHIGSQDLFGSNSHWYKFTSGNYNSGARSNDRNGYFKGFWPLKQLSPTDAKCRYWAFNGQEISLIIDLEAADDGTGAIAYQHKNGSQSANDGAWLGSATGNTYYTAENSWPVYDTAAAANGWGSVGVRTTGILST